MYVVYDHPAQTKASFGNSACHLDPDAGECPSETLITAKCMNDNSYTVVTVYASGKGETSAAAQMSISPFSVNKCCPTTEPAYNPDYTIAWTYIIHCNCNEAVSRQKLRGEYQSLENSWVA